MFVWLYTCMLHIQHMPMRGSPTWGKTSTGPNVYRSGRRAARPSLPPTGPFQASTHLLYPSVFQGNVYEVITRTIDAHLDESVAP